MEQEQPEVLSSEGGIILRIGADRFDFSLEQTDRLLDDIMNAKGCVCEACGGKGSTPSGVDECTDCGGTGWTV